MPLALAEFVHRWKINAQSGRSTAPSHFLDLCDRLGEPHRAAAYGWPADLPRQQILARLLALNHDRPAANGTRRAG